MKYWVYLYIYVFFHFSVAQTFSQGSIDQQWAAQVEHMNTAKCIKVFPTQDTIKKYFQDRTKSTQVESRTFFGITFSNYPLYYYLFLQMILPSENTLITPHIMDRIIYLLLQDKIFDLMPSEDQQILQKFLDPHVLSTFRSLNPKVSYSALDLLTQWWGEVKTWERLYLLDYYWINTSPFRRSSLEFYAGEWESLKQSIIQYPGHLYGVQKIQVSRLKNLGPGIFANAAISLANSWRDELTHPQRMIAVYHEMGHIFDLFFYNGSFTNHDQWRLELWQKISNPKLRVSPYARDPIINGIDYHNEDFAESVVAYRLNPKKLQTRDPLHFEFLANTLFAGFNYLNTGSCSQNAPTYQFPFNSGGLEVIDKLKTRLNSELPRITGISCFKSGTDYLQTGNSTFFINCLIKNALGPDFKIQNLSTDLSEKLALLPKYDVAINLENEWSYLSPEFKALWPQLYQVTEAWVLQWKNHLFKNLTGYLKFRLEVVKRGGNIFPKCIDLINEHAYQNFDKHFQTSTKNNMLLPSSLNFYKDRIIWAQYVISFCEKKFTF